MNRNQLIKIVAYFLIVTPALMIAARVWLNQESSWSRTNQTYSISYDFDVWSSEAYWVKTYLPIANERQQIHYEDLQQLSRGIRLQEEGNEAIRWEGAEARASIDLRFQASLAPLSYEIATDLPYFRTVAPEAATYLSATELIQSDHPRIGALADHLMLGRTTMVRVLQAFYDYTLSIPAVNTSAVTDALLTLQNQEASCNGKSRLFVALCRSAGIPARVAGGLILESATKKTSHLWAEVRVGDTWVPFDALNDHFASLPANYLELYKGDHFLITRSKKADFDYFYQIEPQRANDFPVLALFDVWQLIDEANIPAKMVTILLLLPMGAFLVAVFKNVIGIKTYGVFLPVLIAIALMETGVLPGLVLFSLIAGVVSLVNLPLEVWGIQYNSKIAILLIAVVLAALLIVRLLHLTQWLPATAPLFFPIIILTIISERIARQTEEEGAGKALSLYGSTLLVTMGIYFILSSESIQQFMLTFPEAIFALAGFNLLLGKWIGLRVLEYHRFYQVLKA